MKCPVERVRVASTVRQGERKETVVAGYSARADAAVVLRAAAAAAGGSRRLILRIGTMCHRLDLERLLGCFCQAHGCVHQVRGLDNRLYN